MPDTYVCPGCGSMLPHPDTEGRCTCLSCGRITDVEREHPKVAHTPSGPAGFSFTVTTGPDGTTTVGGTGGGGPGTFTLPPTAERTAKRAGLGCGLGVVLLVVGIVAAVLFAVNGISETVDKAIGRSSSLSPVSDSSALLAVGEEGSIDTLTLVYDSKADSRSAAKLAFGADGAEVEWQSPTFPKDVYDLVAVTDGEVVYLGVGDEVWALAADTGQRRWAGALPDDVSPSCDSCFQMVGGTVVVQTSDGSITAFGPGSAEPRWSRRLVSPAGHLEVAGDLVVVVDDPVTTEPGQVVTIDPATGNVVHTQAPTCPSTERMWELDLSAGDLVVGVPGTGDVVAMFGSGETCAVRWDARTGAVKWSSRMEGVSSIDRDTALVTGAELVASWSSGMVRLDLADGRRVDLQIPAEVRAAPSLVLGGLVVADTATTRGTTRGGIAAFDAASGALRWNVRLPDDAQPASRGTSDALFDGSPRSVLVATPEGGLLVLTFEGTERTYTVRPVNLENGTLARGEPRRFRTRYDSGTPSMAVEAVTPTRLLVTVDGVMQTIPFDEAEAIVTFPDL